MPSNPGCEITEKPNERRQGDYLFRWHTTGVGGGYMSLSWPEHRDFDTFAEAWEAARKFVYQGDWVESIRRQNAAPL